MSASIERPGTVIGVTLWGTADARLCAAVTGAGGLGVLDLGQGDRATRDALAEVSSGRFGVRVPQGCTLDVDDVFDAVGDRADQLAVIVLGWRSAWQLTDIPGECFVLVEVASAIEAQVAVDLGADGLVVRGREAAGRASDLGAFVLLQQVLADPLVTVPVWVCGGIGPDTAAGAVLAGAAGVVLDTQLALLPEADLPAATRAALAPSAPPTLVDGHPLVGQDGFLAQTFVERHGSVARAVRAVLGAVESALAPGAPVLGEGATLARGLGTALPIAQGPMTRVSDQPAFAEVVARHGALPFLALALSTEEQTRAMLTETKAALGDRPWGVGVLGFAPADLRAAQLDVIKEIRPATALIAGGRPDQARALEDVGIATFLHVPSPGLLSQFLAAGARRFVFEGSECGGHVGPLTSFALWSAQVGVLVDAVDAGLPADELQLLFAGGVHDARSAAAVAGVADRLARRGAGVGVLMGTGYLFTAEAVSCGAVRTTFQRQVIAATRTELLQTAPGHATRCVSSPFTGTFHAVGAELLAQGVPEREVWERLELLNTGRLRIASKGVRREGDQLLSVCEGEQLEQGLFMAGEVALLRSEPTTVAALHHEVTRGAAALRSVRSAELRSEVDDEPLAAPLDVAVVGMSAMFPGADGLAAFWSTVVSGADAVTEVPAGRWDVDTYFSPDGGPGRTPSKWGGFLPEIPFDPLGYGIPPATLSAIEPVQLLALEAARRALTDAGYPDGDPRRDRTSVVFGAEAGSDLATATTLRMALPEYVGGLPENLAAQLPVLTEDTFPGRLANVIAGRIANRLDLGGANYTVDAACASSLAAVDIACKELVAGTSDVVLCGGADLHNAVDDYLLFSSVGALSATGRCRTFDASADGIALGEGVACVVLKRLADAERDGDRVYAVIRGVGAGSDGKALGLTAPRPEGQRRAIERAHRAARVSPKDIGLVEAHGTGTVVGDRTELKTLDTVFTEAGATVGSCALGSVKSQIGHTKCAAGLAGLIKAALAVHTGVKPPTLHVTRPNPAWDPETSPFVFHATAVPWTEPPLRRIAGVSAFGFGGTNFHVVLRGHPQADLVRHGRDEWPAELLTFRGADRAAARRQAERMLTLATTNAAHGSPWTLRDLARTAAERADRDAAPIRIAVVAHNLAELATQLRAAVDGGNAVGLHVAGERAQGKLAVLFPGQGSQRPGMLAELFVAFPDLGRLARSVGADTDVIFPPSAFGADTAQADRLRDTRAAQPALGLAGLAVHHLLGRLGVSADLLAGHSYGELVALTAAGAMDAQTLLRLSTARADAILGAAGDDPGTMAAVSAGRAATTAVLDAAGLTGTVVVANDNAPQQVVISGPTPAVDQALAALRDAGLSAQRIPVACAFHSPVVAGAGERFAEALADARIVEPDQPVWSNRTASVYGGDVRAELAAQIGAPVRFAEQVEAMYADGARVFLEAGPGRVLSGLVGKILGDRPHTAIPCDGDGLAGLLDAVARLAVSGVDVRTGWLFAGRDARDVGALTPPKRPGWTVDGAFVRTVDGAFVGRAPARKVTIGTIATSRDEVITDFLRTSRDMIAAQRDVVLGYLGAAPIPDAPASVLPPPTAPTVVESTPSDALSTVIDVIAARTGYPVDMIDPTLDLEADLSVDSIKRTEIAGEVAAKFGSGSVDALVKARTAAAMAEALGGKPKPAAREPLTVVIEVIAARTGYPVDMIDPTLDLEADLSVDSIKRTEIAGEVAAKFGSGSVDALVKARTAAAMAEALGGTPPTVVEPVIAGAPAQRFVLDLVDSDASPTEEITAFVGTHILIAGGDPALADELADQLSARGALALTCQGRPELDAEIDKLDGLISLHALAADEPLLPGAFPLLKSALARRPRWLLAVGPSAGTRGLFRSLAREYPDLLARVVEVDGTRPPVEIAETVVGELLTKADEPVVVRSAAGRQVTRMVPERLGALATAGAGPGGVGAAEAAAIGLDGDSVVLLIGGARGITAQAAIGLARAAGCRIELAGRTAPAAAPEHTAVAAAADLAGVRAALGGLGGRDIAAVERDAREIIAQREVAATLREIREVGGSAQYHQVDVRDGAAVRQLVKQVHAEHGRLDGVVYAAGIIEDRLVADKDPASFDRVYRTKVDGAAALLGVLTELAIEPRFVLFFGSIAAAMGSRGQADYAAANDAMEHLGAAWSLSTGLRALTVHWGPWAPVGPHAGMVSVELGRAYAQRGVALLDPADGVACLLRELAWGDPARHAVVYTASEW